MSLKNPVQVQFDQRHQIIIQTVSNHIWPCLPTVLTSFSARMRCLVQEAPGSYLPGVCPGQLCPGLSLRFLNPVSVLLLAQTGAQAAFHSQLWRQISRTLADPWVQGESMIPQVIFEYPFSKKSLSFQYRNIIFIPYLWMRKLMLNEVKFVIQIFSLVFPVKQWQYLPAEYTCRQRRALEQGTLRATTLYGL